MKHIKEVIQDWLMTSPVVPVSIRNRVKDDVQTAELLKTLENSKRLVDMLRVHINDLPESSRPSMYLILVLTLQRSSGVEVQEYEHGPAQVFSKNDCHLAAERLMTEYVLTIVPPKG